MESNVDRLITSFVTVQPVTALLDCLKRAGFQEPPKSFFSDIICWAGYITYIQGVSLANAIPQLACLLEHLHFSSEGPAARGLPLHMDVNFLTDIFDHEDRLSGICPTRFVYFIQRFVLAKFIAAGKPYKPVLLAMISDCVSLLRGHPVVPRLMLTLQLSN